MADISLKYLLYGEDRTASKAIDGVGKKADGFGTKLTGIASRASGLVGGEVGDVMDKVAMGLDAASGSHDKIQKRMIVTGSVAAGVGGALTMMAQGDIRNQQMLQQAVENTGKGYDGFEDDVSSLIEKQVQFGHTDGEVTESLRVLTQAYGDPKAAVDKMGLATDLAAAKHISLSEAAGLVAKAHGGAGRIFKEFGIQVGENADGTKNYEGALDQLSGKVSGQASASMDTLSGKIEQAKTWLDNAASSIGEKYGPAITAAGAAVTVLGAITDSAAVKTVALKGAQLASSAATGIATAAQWLWNAAMSANPIGIIIIAIAALVAGIIWAYNNVGWFRDLCNAAFEAIGAAARWLWNNAIGPVIRFLLNGFASVAEGIAFMLDQLANIPGFGWAADARDKMLAAAGGARELANKVNDIPDSHNTNVTANTADAQARVDAFARTLNSLHDRTIRVTTSTTTIDAGAYAGKQVSAYAVGGFNVPEGWAVVGEQGPELVYMPGGADVYDANKTRQMMSVGSDIGTPVTGSVGGDGNGVFHLYDADGVLMGTLMGRVQQKMNQSARAITARRR